MYSINGLFFVNMKVTGVERYAIELIKNLDTMIDSDCLEIVMPTLPEELPIKSLKHIKFTSTNSPKTNHNIWEQFVFPSYLKKHQSIGINLCNSCPLFRPDIVCIHDIFYKTFPQFFTTKTSRKMAFKRKLNYWFASKKAKTIVTVSDFSKRQIMENYSLKTDRIFVSREGWEHNNNIEADETIFEKFPQIKKDSYFFSLGQISPHKNMKWVFEIAKRNPDEMFVITGKKHFGTGQADTQALNNVILTGYLSDGEVAALMNHMKALLFPSYCEGFGIPPMEALHRGRKVIMSDRTCLPEIYKNTVSYIDPDNYDVDLDKLVAEKNDDPTDLLKTYTWKNTALQWKNWLSL